MIKKEIIVIDLRIGIFLFCLLIYLVSFTELIIVIALFHKFIYAIKNIFDMSHKTVHIPEDTKPLTT